MASETALPAPLGLGRDVRDTATVLDQAPDAVGIIAFIRMNEDA
jgi:hypothetical protein